MSTKKKIVIAICTMALVIVALVASLIGVIASFNATTSAGGFKISYTAKNVHATIKAEYKVGTASESPAYTTIKTTDGASIMTFTGDETAETTTKSFDSINNITMDKDDIMIIHYQITNTDTSRNTSFKVVLNSNITSNSNLSIQYTNNSEAVPDGGTQAVDDWYDSFNEINTAVGGSSGNGYYNEVSGGSTVNLYIKIEIESKTQDATFDGSFNFELIIN